MLAGAQTASHCRVSGSGVMSIEADSADGLGALAAADDRGGQAGDVEDRPGRAGGVVAEGSRPGVDVQVDNAPEPPAAPALRAVELTLGFGSRVVLSNITADIHRGAVTALIGPTGSGKTTLIRTFNRMNDNVTGYRHT